MIIDSREQLNRILQEEKYNYFGDMGRRNYLLRVLKKHPDYYSWKYVKQMRITSYAYSRRNKNPFLSFRYIMESRRFNSLGRKLGIESGENVFGEGLKIFHTQGNVINGNAVVGKNCCLYGSNCIGNDGIHRECPVLGDNVRVCAGAKVIGPVRIGSNVVIAAGSVVTKSFEEDNVILAGVPARIVGPNNKDFLK